MKWVELSVETPAEFVEPLSQVFHHYGHGGVAIEDLGGYNPDEGETPTDAHLVTVKTYIPLDADMEERRGRIDLGVRLVAHLSPISSLRERVIEEDDWQDAWKKHFRVLHIGKRIIVVPSWRRYRPQESAIVIRLDPGMAFGTGHHPTTRMCLQLLEDYVGPGMDILDVGCGSGILSIAAAKLGAASVLGLEIDPAAVEIAESNVRQNRVDKTTRIAEGTLPHHDIPAGSFDIAVANISAKVILALTSELASAVKPGGTVIASGFLLEVEDEVSQCLAEAGAPVVHRHAEGDWVSLVGSVLRSTSPDL